MTTAPLTTKRADCVVVDGSLVCSRVWMDNTWLMKEFMAMLKRHVGE